MGYHFSKLHANFHFKGNKSYILFMVLCYPRDVDSKLIDECIEISMFAIVSHNF